MFNFITSFGSESPPFCSTKMKKAKRRLTVDPIDFERECDYVESGQRSSQVKLTPLAVMIWHQLAAVNAYISWSSSLFCVEWINSPAWLISLRPSQAAVYNVDEGVSESALTEANVASIFHQILKEQRDQQGNKMGVKWTFQPRSEANDFFSSIMKTSYWHFLVSVFLQTTELCHPAPSPSSATLRWAVEVAGAPSTAAASTCPALTTHQGRTSRSNRSPSTSLTRARWATPPRRAWTPPTPHHRSRPSLSHLFHSDLKYHTQDYENCENRQFFWCWSLLIVLLTFRNAHFHRSFFSLSCNWSGHIIS